MSTEMNVRSLLDMALATSTEGNSFCFNLCLTHSFSLVCVVTVNRLFHVVFLLLIVKIEQSITMPRRFFAFKQK